MKELDALNEQELDEENLEQVNGGDYADHAEDIWNKTVKPILRVLSK